MPELSTISVKGLQKYRLDSHKKAIEMAGDRLHSAQSPVAGDPSAVREQLAEFAEMGFDFAVLTFPRFQELDDMKLFVDKVMPALA